MAAKRPLRSIGSNGRLPAPTPEKSSIKNAFITDFPLTRSTVPQIVQAGRARWKVENENNNVLKTKGHHLEHHYGHGSQFLSTTLLTLNLLAFLEIGRASCRERV